MALAMALALAMAMAMALAMALKNIFNCYEKVQPVPVNRNK
jgi:hypothetical protein